MVKRFWTLKNAGGKLRTRIEQTYSVGTATLAAILVLAPGCVLVSGLGRDSAWLVHKLRRGKVTAPPAA